MKPFTITVTDSVAEAFELGAKALGVTTEEAIAEYLDLYAAGVDPYTFWIASENIHSALERRAFDTREEAEQLAERCNHFLTDARAKGEPCRDVVSVEEVGGKFGVFIANNETEPAELSQS